ncbi:hypothetical protein NXY28_19665 [Bacteroides thetaiotaomicron]|nr:hypothetical protein NXY28_19665 [Bacteroides thetaiotaomicron]
MKNYEQKIANLRMRKLAQTQEKIEKEGLLDEDDYGRVVLRKICGISYLTIPMVLSTDLMHGLITFAA